MKFGEKTRWRAWTLDWTSCMRSSSDLVAAAAASRWPASFCSLTTRSCCCKVCEDRAALAARSFDACSSSATTPTLFPSFCCCSASASAACASKFNFTVAAEMQASELHCSCVWDFHFSFLYCIRTLNTWIFTRNNVFFRKGVNTQNCGTACSSRHCERAGVVSTILQLLIRLWPGGRSAYKHQQGFRYRMNTKYSDKRVIHVISKF